MFTASPLYARFCSSCWGFRHKKADLGVSIKIITDCSKHYKDKSMMWEESLFYILWSRKRWLLNCNLLAKTGKYKKPREAPSRQREHHAKALRPENAEVFRNQKAEPQAASLREVWMRLESGKSQVKLGLCRRNWSLMHRVCIANTWETCTELLTWDGHVCYVRLPRYIKCCWMVLFDETNGF